MFKRLAQKLTKKPVPRPRQEDEGIEMQTILPRLEPDAARHTEPGRPYQGYVKSEAREYWQEIAKERNLTKPTRLELRLAIACLSLWNRSGYSTPGINPGPGAMQPGLKTDTAQAVEPRRPYQDFVENEARVYWQETAKEHNLTKPDQEEIRTAAMPILCRALRNRFGSRRHRAVAAMVQHTYESGLIKRPFSDAHESPSYIDALIQQADDANWLAREIPLPDHPPPHHPPIYYTIGSGPDGPVPVPREDALIRGGYLYNFKWYRSVLIKPHRMRLIKEDYFYPSLQPSDDETDQNIFDQVRPYYTLVFMPVRGTINRRPVNILLRWKEHTFDPPVYCSSEIYFLHFSPNPWDMIPGQPLS